VDEKKNVTLTEHSPFIQPREDLASGEALSLNSESVTGRARGTGGGGLVSGYLPVSVDC
jgi:hypothetical protein